MLPEDLPDSWRCPICGATRDRLVKVPAPESGNRPETARLFEPPEKKQVEKRGQNGIIVGADNPETLPGLGQEYGRALGLGGIGQGISYHNNFRALARIKLRTRLITAHRDPVFESEFFGTKVSMPVLGAPMSGFSHVSELEEEDFAYQILEGCRLAGTLGFTGNTSKDYQEIHPAIRALQKTEGHGVSIFKPQAQEVVLELLKQAEEAGAVAAGVDVDGAGSVNFTLAGKPVFRKTIEELKELKNATSLPFIIKGIMCAEDALAAVDAGVDMIAVSNHGGRVLDSTPGVADVLPGIVKAVRDTKRGKKLVITADGGVRTGYDVLKMLAIGADFVLIGRPLAREALPNGTEGVKRFLEFIKTDIKKAMIMTSCNTLDEVNEEILILEK